MGDLSAHFDRTEFACPHCGAGCASPQLVAILEALRAEVGAPLRVVSGFRCVPHNTAVGGVSESRHIHGDAADLVAGYATVGQCIKAGAVGIGTKDGRPVHIDWRPGPAARWIY